MNYDPEGKNVFGASTPIPDPTPIPEPTPIPGGEEGKSAQSGFDPMAGGGYSASWNSEQHTETPYSRPNNPSAGQNGYYYRAQNETPSAAQSGSRSGPVFGAPTGSAYGTQSGNAYGTQNNPYGTQSNPYGTQNNPYGAQNGNDYGAQSGVVFGTPQSGGWGSGWYPPEKKKTVKYASRTAVVWAILLAILLSVSCGLGGAFLGAAMAKKNPADVPSQNTGDVQINHYTVQGVENAKTDGSVTSVYQKVGSAVVEIRTETVTTSSVYGQYVTSGAGSGVLISKDGYIITCAHVIEGATKITVTMSDGTVYEAKTVGSDADTDIAVVKIESEKDLPFASFGDSDRLVVGQTVVAIGNPLGSLGGTTTSGIISALNREIEIEGVKYTLLQTNAAINPGNSGGGLFDTNGLLIGVVNAKSGGNSIEGLGFAIPSVTSEKIASELIANGYVKGRPMLGVRTFEVQSQEDYYNYWKYQHYINEYGVYVAESDTDLFKVGDRLVALNGVETPDYATLKQEINKYSVGETIKVTVSRDRQLVTFDLTLQEKTQ